MVFFSARLAQAKGVYPAPTLAWSRVWAPVEPNRLLMVTSCSQILPEGRSVTQAHLATDADRSCENFNSGGNVRINCADHSVSSLGAAGLVAMETDKGVSLWACVIRESKLRPGTQTVSNRWVIPEHHDESRRE